MNEKNRIFIFGIPRTGTTITLEIIKRVPEARVFGENPMHWPTSYTIDNLLKDGKIVANKFPGMTFNMPQIYKQFPNAKYIFTTRNLEATKKSYENFAKYRPSSDLGNMFHMGVDVSHSKFNEMIQPYLEKENCYVLKLEDLHDNKHETVNKLFDFLEIEMCPEVENFVEEFVSKAPKKNYPGNARSFAPESGNKENPPILKNGVNTYD